MSRLKTIRPEFAEYVPRELEFGVLYISIPYKTTVHRCACGCGSKITLPINPAKWRLTYDGETVSLSPSVGNWSYPCQSHYWIKQNRIDWAPRLPAAKIEAIRRRDASARAHYLESRGVSRTVGAETEQSSSGRGLLDRIRGLFRR